MAVSVEIDRGKLGFTLKNPGRIRTSLPFRKAAKAGTLVLEGSVKRIVVEQKIVGATGLFKDKITSEVKKKTASRYEGFVTSDVPYVEFVEAGSGPHAEEKHPMFWINKLLDYVRRVIQPAAGANPVTGVMQSKEQTEKAIAVGVGRKIEAFGTDGHFVFRQAWEKDGEKATEVGGEILLDAQMLERVI